MSPEYKPFSLNLVKCGFAVINTWLQLEIDLGEISEFSDLYFTNISHTYSGIKWFTTYSLFSLCLKVVIITNLGQRQKSA